MYDRIARQLESRLEQVIKDNQGEDSKRTFNASL